MVFNIAKQEKTKEFCAAQKIKKMVCFSEFVVPPPLNVQFNKKYIELVQTPKQKPYIK